MKTSYRLFIVLAGAFALGLGSGKLVSLQYTFAQGYDGLFATDNSGATGYDGLITGTTPPAQTAPQQQPVDVYRPPGAPAHMKTEDYSPVFMPPTAPRSRAAAQRHGLEDIRPNSNSRILARREQARTAGGQDTFTPKRSMRTIDDVRTFRMPDKVAASEMKEAIRTSDVLKQYKSILSPQHREMLSVPGLRVDGMLPGERSAKAQVDTIMYFVRKPGQSREQRKYTAEEAAKRLRNLAHTYEYYQSFPVELYQHMGAPEAFIKEEKEGNAKSLERVYAALNELRKYQ